MSNETIQVLAISGSLRKAAFNTALLRAAQELAPEGMSIQIYADLASIPPYDDDVRLAGYPPAVAALRDRVDHSGRVPPCATRGPSSPHGFAQTARSHRDGILQAMGN